MRSPIEMMVDQACGITEEKLRDVILDVPRGRFLRSLGGGRLAEGSPVRYVYIDEAGTSANEQVAVVAGVIVHADEQWRRASEYLNFLRDKYVPEQIREGYVFHATDLFSGERKSGSDLFQRGHRWRLLMRLLSAPRKLGLGVALGYRWRESTGDKGEPTVRHMFALAMCLKQANDYIRANYPGEVATVIAEDASHIRRELKMIPRWLKGPDTTPFFREAPFDVMVDSIHFTDKRDAPLIQLADACAFAVRRRLSGGSHGQTLIEALIGGKDDPFEPSGAGIRMLTWRSNVRFSSARVQLVVPTVQWLS